MTNVVGGMLTSAGSGAAIVGGATTDISGNATLDTALSSTAGSVASAQASVVGGTVVGGTVLSGGMVSGSDAASVSAGLGGAVPGVSSGLVGSVGTGVAVSSGGTIVSVGGTIGTGGEISADSGSDGSSGSGGTAVGSAGSNTPSSCTITQTPSDSFIVATSSAGITTSNTIDSGTAITITGGTAYVDAPGNAELVAHLYKAAFDRSADLGGLQYWTEHLNDAAVAPVTVANTFAGSAEFIGTYGALDNTAYVDRLYHNVLGRDADTSGAGYWTSALDHGASRGAVLLGFSNSAENIQSTLNVAGDKQFGEAYRLYQAALGRTPDHAGVNYWTGVLKEGVDAQQVAQGFLQTGEFAAKYGQLSAGQYVNALYQNVLGRSADSAGEQYWTAELSAGVTRSGVLVGFADSLENRENTSTATHDGWVLVPH